MSGSIAFFPNKDTITSEERFTNGTFTVPQGINHLLIAGAGGGGGGQSGNGDNNFAQSGEGGGGVIPHPIWVRVNPGDVLNYTLGTGGIGGAAGVNFSNGSDGGQTVVTLADGNSVVFDGGRGGGNGSTEGFSTAYGSHTRGGGRIFNGQAAQSDAEDGQSSHYAPGGTAGLRSPGAEQAFDPGGGGGGAGYEAGGTGGNGRDLGLGRGGNPINGSNGGISAGGGGGGAEGSGDDNGINSGAGGNGGPGMVIFMWSENK